MGYLGSPSGVQMERLNKRLGVDTIDLYYYHRIDQTVPIETSVTVLAKLVKTGKIQYIGLSEPSPATLRRAYKVHPIAAIQVETSNADIPNDDFGKHIPKYSEVNFPKILWLVNRIREIGEKHNATSGQVTLAFVLAQGDDIIPIPGTKNIKYAGGNVGALKVKLTPEDIEAIRQAIAETELTGDQYPTALMSMLHGDIPEPSKA
ncbi:hypothetical protein FRC11_010307 [Ceratobasidium sp. 423]|nr:hypothetical protein FRC11_010307 [Ceratobasidium sp. 423]